MPQNGLIGRHPTCSGETSKPLRAPVYGAHKGGVNGFRRVADRRGHRRRATPRVPGAIRLYLLTAQRKDEILGMRWDEIDLASGRTP